jgi:PAS domain S-box-containing protein
MHKDGSIVDVVLTSTPLDPADLAAGVVFTALDVTEERWAQAELETTQALLTAAIEQTPAGVLVADAADGRIRIANAAALGIRGETPEPLTDIPIELHPERWRTFYPDGREYAAEDLPLSRAILQGETSRDVEVVIQRESGEGRWVSANAAPVRDAEGEIVAGVVVFPDITERKLAEQALREREEMFRFLFEQAPIGMAITDLEGRYLRVNRAHCEVLGYRREEMLSLNFADITPPEEVAINVELREQMLRGEIPYFQLEKRFITKAGAMVYALLQVALMHDAQGQPLHFLGQIVDITDRKEAEAALSRSVERYRRFVEQSYEGVWEIDQRGVTVYVNSRMAEILGYESAQALLGRRLYDFFPRSYAGSLSPLIEEDQPGKAQDCVLTKADGSDVYAILSALSHRDQEGQFSGATLFVTDITQRKLAERALRHSESRYRTLFENASDAIFIYDLNGRFLEVNRVACQRLGLSFEELRQMTPADIESPEYAARLPMRIDELQRYGHHLFETVHVRQDGTRIPTELSSRLIEYDGEPAVLSIARDLTERKQMALVMVRTERLAAMGQLAAALAHEINNPLQSIGSSMELALDFPLSEEERLEYLEAVRQEIDRLMSLTSKVLDFARPMRLEREPISLSEAVRYAITLAGKQLQHSRIRLDLELPEDMPLIKASRDQLAQVFLNLVINAIEAMPDGGRLNISAHAENGQAVLNFRDTGPGIPEQALEAVFEPFHTTKEEGTGLGLAVSYSIIQQHGGTIAASNAPGGGALFTIVLPETPMEEMD